MVVEGNAEEISQTPAFSKELLQKAESGDADAQLEIATCYGEGLGVERNKQTAFEWVKKSAAQGNRKAILTQARCYLFGLGVPWDEEKAQPIFQEAESGQARAQTDLGNYFSGKYGRTEKRDPQKALFWWEKAADQGYEWAQLNLAKAYVEGLGGTKDYQKAFTLFQKAADQGNSEAVLELGICHREGRGVSKDPVKAKKWFEKSAQQNNAVGLASLGEFYERGWGDTPVDFQKATVLYQKAADQNYAWAQERLGYLYSNGIGVEKDLAKAFAMFQKAADLGSPSAQLALGMLYYNGKIPENKKPSDPRKPSYRKKDFQKALAWTLKSAEGGYKDAQYNVAILYWRGDGTQVDLEKARFWMGKVADRGDPQAKEVLGWITANQNADKIIDGWFSFGDKPTTDSPANPQQNP